MPRNANRCKVSLSREAGLHRTLTEVQAERIRNLPASVGSNKTRAAKILGIDRKTLREKLELYEPKRQ